MANIPLLEKTLETIEEVDQLTQQNKPKGLVWNQLDWRTTSNGYSDACGTAMCFAGWAVHLAGYTYFTPADDVDYNAYAIIDDKMARALHKRHSGQEDNPGMAWVDPPLTLEVVSDGRGVWNHSICRDRLLPSFRRRRKIQCAHVRSIAVIELDLTDDQTGLFSGGNTINDLHTWIDEIKSAEAVNA